MGKDKEYFMCSPMIIVKSLWINCCKVVANANQEKRGVVSEETSSQKMVVKEICLKVARELSKGKEIVI